MRLAERGRGVSEREVGAVGSGEAEGSDGATRTRSARAAKVDWTVVRYAGVLVSSMFPVTIGMSGRVRTGRGRERKNHTAGKSPAGTSISKEGP